jgi:hypothetical protein
MLTEGREANMSEVVAIMAKKKSDSQPMPEDEQREELIAVRCKHSYKRWLLRFAKSERTTPSHLVDQGLMQLAKVRGFELPPDR